MSVTVIYCFFTGNTLDIIINELASGKKLSKALSAVYSKRKVSIPYDEELFSVDVRELGMSNRATNALMRAKLTTINQLIMFVEDRKITDIRNLGISSCEEIMETILDYAWDNMDTSKKANFLMDVMVRNAKYLKV